MLSNEIDFPVDGSQPQARSASLVDRRSGLRREIEFFKSGDLRVFGSVHLPIRDPVGGLVICPPILAELVTNYRREVMLASALAARGVAVIRFHYRGTGHSDGSSSMTTFDSMCEDTLAAAEHLARRSGARTIALAGTRLGGLVAATASSRIVSAPLALWEPAVDATRYFRDVYRAYLMNRLKEGSSALGTARTLADELHQSDSFDMLGYSIDRPLFDSSLGRIMEESLGASARPLLLVQIGPRQQLKADFAELAGKLVTSGFGVTTHSIVDREAWWLTGDQWGTEETRESTTTLVGITSDWLSTELGRWEAAI